MSPPTRGRLIRLLGLCLAAAWPGPARAQDDAATPVALARWEWSHDGQQRLVVSLARSLTPKQRAMIDGGFTTVSQLTLLPAKGSAGGAAAADAPLYTLRCSVKFDAWEETYDVARLDDAPRSGLVKQFNDYGDMCLGAVLTGGQATALATQGGALLVARLAVKQTSLDEAAKIKEWMVQQQSGVMQSLFVHMLGELTLSQTLEVKVSVPPPPDAPDESARNVPPPAGAAPGAVTDTPPRAPADKGGVGGGKAGKTGAGGKGGTG